MANRTGICLSCGYANESTCCRKCKSNNVCWIDSVEWEERQLEYLELININKASFQALKVRCKDLYYSLVGYPYPPANYIFEIFKYISKEFISCNKT